MASQTQQFRQITRYEELVITRVLDAPREAAWKAWTDPTRFMLWWGPKGFISPACKIDLRVGGKYLACMRSPEGQDYWSTGVYREIVPKVKLVYTDNFSDRSLVDFQVTVEMNPNDTFGTPSPKVDPFKLF